MDKKLKGVRVVCDSITERYFCTQNILSALNYYYKIEFYTVPHESPKKDLKVVHGDTELENFSVHWYRECNSSGIRTDNNEKFGREVFS